MPANGREIIARFIKREQERSNFDERWERMAPFIAPSRVGITGAFAPGDKQTRGVYDSTSMMAAELMAMFIAGHIINPSQRWFNYVMEQNVYHDTIQEWLEECRDLTLKRLSHSLFYAEGPEALIDYGGFGTGFLMIEEVPQPINRTVRGFRGFYFNAEKTGRFVIEEGIAGIVDRAYRKYKMSAEQINERWGAAPSARIPQNVSYALKEGNPTKEFTIVHSIYPRPKAEQDSYAGGAGMPWASCWVEFESKEVIFESGYRVFPAAIPRYHKTPGEAYGRGRGDLAFPDTWTLNTAKRMSFEDWALKIRPPILHSHDSVFGTLRLIPGGPTSVNTHGRPLRDVVAPFETGSRPEVNNIVEEQLRKSIRSIFYVDQILALLEVSKSEMTAFEFARKIQLLFRLMGPVYGRAEREYLNQIVEILFDLQFAAGAFPPPPPEIYQTNGVINVEFQNPIAKAQREGDAEALMLAFNDLAPLIQLHGPSVINRLDPRKTADGILQIRGVPALWQRNDDELAAHEEAISKQQTADLELERAEQAAGAAGKAAPLLKMLAGGQGGGAK